MLVYPQLTTGATVEYPLDKQRYFRVIDSKMEDGSLVKAFDAKGTYLRWVLRYRDLSDQEAQALEAFFAEAQGKSFSFAFLDPTANLLAWTEDFSQPNWQATGLTFENGVTDPLGTTRATRVHFLTGPTAQLAQISPIPGLVHACFSVYLRADTPCDVTLTRSAGTQSSTAVVTATPDWRRHQITGFFPGTADDSVFQISAAATAVIDIFGPQVEAQINPSPYIISTARSGVYQNARFDMKQMDINVAGFNRNECVVAIRCNLPSGD